MDVVTVSARLMRRFLFGSLDKRQDEDKAVRKTDLLAATHALYKQSDKEGFKAACQASLLAARNVLFGDGTERPGLRYRLIAPPTHPGERFSGAHRR